MSTISGNSGLLSLGGYVVGTPLVDGAVGQSATAAIVDGLTSGVVRPGDDFTVAGDGQTYTVVTGELVGGTSPGEVNITFTPGVVPGGGWANDAAVTFVSNSVAQVKSFEIDAERELLETTVMRDAARTFDAGFNLWTIRFDLLLDPADPEQVALIDGVTSNGGATGEFAMTVVAYDGVHWWGDITVLRGTLNQEIDAMVEFSCEANGRGALGTDFNP